MITLRKLGIATALALTAIAAPSVPVDAATTPVSGMFVFDDTGKCTAAPKGFDELTFVISGDLEGCWYTDVLWSKDFGHPGLYLEVGQELFVGTVNGESGSFTTKYVFEAKLGADGLEVSRRVLEFRPGLKVIIASADDSIKDEGLSHLGRYLEEDFREVAA